MFGFREKRCKIIHSAQRQWHLALKHVKCVLISATKPQNVARSQEHILTFPSIPKAVSVSGPGINVYQPLSRVSTKDIAPLHFHKRNVHSHRRNKNEKHLLNYSTSKDQ
jgi:hypothetical protein